MEQGPITAGAAAVHRPCVRVAGRLVRSNRDVIGLEREVLGVWSGDGDKGVGSVACQISGERYNDCAANRRDHTLEVLVLCEDSVRLAVHNVLQAKVVRAAAGGAEHWPKV